MLNEFRARVGMTGLRQINDQLRHWFIQRAADWPHAVGLIDATDLEAACDGFKKKKRKPTRRTALPWACAPTNRVRVAGTSVTKSIRCACGGGNTPRRCCWSRW